MKEKDIKSNYFEVKNNTNFYTITYHLTNAFYLVILVSSFFALFPDYLFMQLITIAIMLWLYFQNRNTPSKIYLKKEILYIETKPKIYKISIKSIKDIKFYYSNIRVNHRRLKRLFIDYIEKDSKEVVKNFYIFHQNIKQLQEVIRIIR